MTIQGAVERNDVNNDGFLDWAEFIALMMEAKSNYTMGLYKKYDLNGDGEIDQEEMDKVVAKIKDSGDEDMSKTMRENLI